MISRLFSAICLLALLRLTQGAHKHFNGVAHVNSKAFDKIIPRFKVALVKFDLVHSMGQTQTAFKEVADWSLDDDDTLVVEVCVEYKGINHDLMERFELRKKELPQYMLFVRGRDKPVHYMGDILRSKDLIAFVEAKSKIWFGYPVFMQKFDMLVQDFFEAEPKARRNIIDTAENATKSLDDDVMKERSLIYVDTMREILEHGEKRLIELHQMAHDHMDKGLYGDFMEKDRMAAHSRIMDVFINREKEVKLRKRAEEL